jgi:hypothetical protein
MRRMKQLRPRARLHQVIHHWHTTVAKGGRVWSGRGHGGRGGNRDRNNNRRQEHPRRSPGAAFKGNTDGMKNNVFQCYGETSDRQHFTKTLGMLAEHINKIFTFPQDVASICKTFKINIRTQPSRLSEVEYKDMAKKMIWEAQIKSDFKRIELLERNSRAVYAIVWWQ